MPDMYKFLLLNAFNRTSLNITSSEFLLRDPNEFYQGADIAWMMMASALVFLMIPGMGMFYSGSSAKCSAISMMWLSMMTIAVIGLQWWLFGYSIAFTGSNVWWGGSDAIAFHNSLFEPWGDEAGTKIPQMVFALFQGMFACFTGAIISGAVIRTEQPTHFLVFIFIWTTFIYDPIARSTWNPVGWANYWEGNGGVFDFAGGTVVHIVSAITSVVYSMWPKWKRQIFRQTHLTIEQIGNEITGPSKPYNVINTMLGTALIYVGWFGFNGGSALGANMRAVSACMSTHLAACAGAFTGTALEYWAAWWRGDQGRFSVIGFCNGVLTGLVCITPAAGYVPIWSSPIFGVLGAGLCFLVEGYSDKWLDIHHIFVMHGFAGFIGMLLTAAFASAEVAGSDGYTVIVMRKWQIGIQLSDVLVHSAYSAIGTLLILILMECVTILYRKFRTRDAPEFQLIHDENIIVRREIGEDFMTVKYEDGEEMGNYPGSSAGAEGRGGTRQASVVGGPVGGGESSLYGANS